MKKWVLLVVILGVSFSAWGASTKKNRDDSLIFVGITPIGIHIPTLLTRPIGLGVYLGDSWMIGAEAGTFTFDFDDDDTEADGTYVNTGIYGRWFLGNSFNLGLAIHQRDFSADALTTAFDPAFGAVRLDASLDAKATVGSLIIGNQWIMDFGLVLALDWVVLSGLISSSVDVSLTGTFIDPVTGSPRPITDLNPAAIAEAEKDLEDLGEFVNQVSAFPGILIFTIGWAF